METAADRAPRLITAALAVAAIFTFFVISGFACGGQVVFGALIIAGTVVGEVLYHLVGKKKTQAEANSDTDPDAPAGAQPSDQIIDLAAERNKRTVAPRRKAA